MKREELLVDEDVRERLKGLRLSARVSAQGYVVVRSSRGPDRGKDASLARLIMGAWPGQIVDHVDGNPLNNFRSNLRFVDTRQSAWNTRHKRGASGYLGVWPQRHGRRLRYKAAATINGRTTHIGWFKVAKEAAIARDAFVWKMRKEYGVYNFPLVEITRSIEE
jgi:hypothetical protein